MLISKRMLNFNNGMETKCFSSHLYVLSPNCFWLHRLRVGGEGECKNKSAGSV